jgi:CheY-like chemotaxis protein
MPRPVLLVVEDEAITRLGLVDALEDAGFELLEASNADEAIAILETRNDIRIVLTDIEMPGSMNGLKLAAAIRGRWPPIELILLSGAVTPKELPERAVFFPKPFRIANLIGAVRSFLP